MSGRMQENSDIAARLVPEETRAGGMTTPVLWRAEASIRMERMASALVTASKEAIASFAKFLTVHIIHGSIPSETSPMWKPANWRAVCGKAASTVRREGRRKPSLPLSGATVRLSGPLAPAVLRPLDCLVARAPRNNG